MKDKEKLNNPLKAWQILSALLTMVSFTQCIVTKKTYLLFLPIVYIGEGILALGRARDIFDGVKIGVQLNFQSDGAHYWCRGRIRASH